MSAQEKSSGASGGRRTPQPAETGTAKACQSCRGLKVRCFPATSSENSGKCQRCARLDKTCIFSGPQRRKQRKRTDARVAELEKEMKTLRDLLRSGIRTVPLDASHQDTIPGMNASGRWKTSSKGQDVNSGTSSFSSHRKEMKRAAKPISLPELDIIDRGLVSMSLAAELYSIFNNDLALENPIITFPSSYTVDDLRRDKPILFLAVLGAAASKTDPDLYGILSKEAIEIYASKFTTKNAKSLELVQSILVTMVWYNPPDEYNHLRFHQYIYQAATMALELGITSKPLEVVIHSDRAAPNSSQIDATAEAKPSPETLKEIPDQSTIEGWRTCLACYLVCSGVSLTMRRPSTLRFTSWIDTCLHLLENLPSLSLFDKRLVAFSRLASLAEEILIFFALDSPESQPVMIGPETETIMTAFKERLEAWKENLDPDIMNASLHLMYHHATILLHEVALHCDHQVADFRPPYFVDRPRTIPESDEPATTPPIDAVMACVESAHALLDLFLSLELDEMRCMPVKNYVAVTYAAVVLSKIYLSTCNPESEIGRVIDQDSLMIEHYSSSLVAHLWKAAGAEKFKVPTKFLVILSRLDGWLKRAKVHGLDEGDEGNVIKPLVQLSMEGSPPYQACTEVNAASRSRLMAEPKFPDFLTGVNSPFYTTSPVTAVPIPAPSHPICESHVPQPFTSHTTEVPYDFAMDFDPNVMHNFGHESVYPDPTQMGSYDNWVVPVGTLGHMFDESMTEVFEWDPSQHLQN